MRNDLALPTWGLTTAGWAYLLQCAGFALVVRLIFSVFRAMAVRRGDFPESEKEPGKNWGPVRAFWECFKGFSKSKAHADLWLHWLIWFAELAAYPVLIKMGYFSTIGGWLALKTAGGWSGWKVSRTSFNRFLLANLMVLAVAFFWLSHYVQVK